MRAHLLVILVAGCGFQLNGAGDGGANTDGALADGETSDAPSDGMPADGTLGASCLQAWLDHTIAFDTPTALTELNTTSFERDPFVSVDQLTIWFSNGGMQSQGGGDVFKARRAGLTVPFGAAARDPSFSTSNGAESKMSMTADQLFAVVATSVPTGAGGTDIFETTRSSAGVAWGALDRAHTLALATSSSELDPFVTPDGLALYYSPASGGQRIVAATRATTADPFGSVVDVTGVNDNGQSSNFDPMLFASERVIVFASDRTADDNGDNIWYATRASTSDAFGAPQLLAGVNSELDDGDPHVSADGCTIYFARDIGGGVDWELFVASAPSS